MRSQLMWRLLGPVLAVSLLLLFVGAGAAWYVHRLDTNVSLALDRELTSVIACEKLVLTIRDMRFELDRYGDTSDRSILDALLANRARLDGNVVELERALNDDANVHALRLRNSGERFFQLLKQGVPQSDAELKSLRDELTAEMLSPAQHLLIQNRDEAAHQSRHNQLTAHRVGIGLLVLGLCGAGAGLLAGFGIARGVSRSIERLGGSLREMADSLTEAGATPEFNADGGLSELQTAMQSLANSTTSVVRQLHETRQHAERSEQLAAVGQLAAGLAHEIRNPLTAIKLLVQAAAEGRSALAGRDLDVLQAEVARLENLLSVFLDFARPPLLQKKLLHLPQFIEPTIELVRPRCQQQGVQISCEDWGDGAMIEADAQQLRQVLLNVLLNAADAMPLGGNLTVNVAHDDGSNYVSIRVVDEGPGLPAELGQRIFDPFVSTKETGIGLGLSICKTIVESHGGEIEADNRVDGGAVFTIRLPVAGDQEPIRRVPR